MVDFDGSNVLNGMFSDFNLEHKISDDDGIYSLVKNKDFFVAFIKLLRTENILPISEDGYSRVVDFFNREKYVHILFYKRTKGMFVNFYSGIHKEDCDISVSEDKLISMFDEYIDKCKIIYIL